ncbi:MAG: hypothetical protein AB1758_07510 [Candidatus Eremiobacterota bacterium]
MTDLAIQDCSAHLALWRRGNAVAQAVGESSGTLDRVELRQGPETLVAEFQPGSRRPTVVESRRVELDELEPFCGVRLMSAPNCAGAHLG